MMKKLYLSLLIIPLSLAINTASGQTFTPLNVPGLKLWLACDSGLTLLGNNVVVWGDLSGQGNHATQINTTYQPILTPSSCGSCGVRFDGIDDGMATPLKINAGDFTVVLIYNTYSTSDQRVINGSNNFLIGPFGYQYNVYASGFVGGKPLVPSAYVIQSVEFRSTSSLVTNYINSSLFGALATFGYPDTVSLAASAILPQSFDGILMEAIIYTNVSTVYRDSVEKYLFNKYNTCLTGVSDLSSDAIPAVYPNPVTDHFTISSSASAFHNPSVTIFNTMGEKVFEKDISGVIKDIPIQFYGASGIYFLKIKEGTRERVVKIAKE